MTSSDESMNTNTWSRMASRADILWIGLLYYEVTDDVSSAIAREKQIKGWRRSKKVALVESANPGWRDLSVEITDSSSPRFFVAPTSTSSPRAPRNDTDGGGAG